jgi:hypothetical protein
VHFVIELRSGSPCSVPTNSLTSVAVRCASCHCMHANLTNILIAGSLDRKVHPGQHYASLPVQYACRNRLAAGVPCILSPSSLRSRLLNGLGDQYHDILTKAMHVGRLARYGWPFGPVANDVLPKTPGMFENAVQPAAQRKSRSLRPPRLLKKLVVGGAVVCAHILRRIGRGKGK